MNILTTYYMPRQWIGWYCVLEVKRTVIPQINFRVLYLYNFILIAAFHFNVKDFFFLFLALIVDYLIFMFNAYFYPHNN